jgi:acyl carrier protein
VNRQEIEKRVMSVIVVQLGVPKEKVTPESVIAIGVGTDTDICTDSLGVVELILGLEEEFDIDIEDDDVEGLKTVKNIVDYVESHA